MKPALGRILLGCLCALAVSGCASLWPQTAQLGEGLPQGLPERIELTAVPFFPQVEYQCGPAALATTLVNSGVKVTPDDLVSQVYIPERKGSLQIEMMAAARRHGLVSYELEPRFEDLLREIASGTPVIVLQNLGFIDGWHYAVAIGYDYERGELILRSGETERELLPFAVHEMVWKRSGYWAMVAVAPGRIPATADEGRWLASIAALERSGGKAAARIAYASFLERWPQNLGAAIGLANAHHAPDSVVVLNNLAQTLSDQGRHEEALSLIERAAASPGRFAQAVHETRQLVLDRIAAAKKREPGN